MYNSSNLLILLIFTFCSCQTPKDNLEQERPNIIIIYTDDQGYGDVSALNCHLSEKYRVDEGRIG